MKKNKRHGFTLVEIMIVLAILVLLIAMVGPKLLKQQDKADVQLTQQQIENVDKALEFYKVEKRKFPSTDEGLKQVVSYLDPPKIPTDPWGNEIRYAFPPKYGQPDKPIIWSIGPDGKDNTSDDVTNWPKDAAANGEGLGEEFDLDSDPGLDAGVDDFASQDTNTNP